MADPKIRDHSEEMEEQLHRLEDHIDAAAKQVRKDEKDADITGDVAGDWEDEQDRGGGDDPKGAAEAGH